MYGCYGIIFKFIDFMDIKVFKESIIKKIKFIWIEMFINLMLKLIDIKVVIEVVKLYSIFICVDNIFVSFYL